MEAQIAELRRAIEAESLQTPEALEQFRLQYTGRKGVIAQMFADLRTVADADRRRVGQLLNELKDLAQARFQSGKANVENQALAAQAEAPTDLTLPGLPHALGGRHPLTIVRDRIVQIFTRVGFSVADGPEVEDDWHNFSALNFPPDHPARDMQDTFFVRRAADGNDLALRTHTSSVQVRLMTQQPPPLRAVMPGRVFRNEAISARAHCVFHQIEGLYVDENVSFVDLKQTLYYFARELFGPQTRVRFRASYFPFTEISAEMDISCQLCGGKGCHVCKHSGWVEILGSGMVDPQVLQNCGIDPERYAGFAFGMGIERIAMLLYQIGDLRLFTENDVRFLRQFHHLG